MAFDLEAARKDGVSDFDIATALAQRHNYDLGAAMKDNVPLDNVLTSLLSRENSKSEYDLAGGIKDVGRVIIDLPARIAGAAGNYVAGGRDTEDIAAHATGEKRDWTDEIRDYNKALDAKRQKQTVDEGGDPNSKVFPAIPGVLENGITRRDIQELGGNQGFSVATMLPSAVVGKGAGVVGAAGGGALAAATLGPEAVPAGRVLGERAGELAGQLGMGFLGGKRMDQAMITNQILDAKSQSLGRPLNKAEAMDLLERTKSLREDHAFWEALPESLSTVAGLAMVKDTFTAALGKKFGLAFAGHILGEQAVETGSEAWTQQHQHNDEVKLGLDKGELRGNTLKDWKQSYDEVAPATLLLGASHAAVGATAGKIASLAKDGMSKPVVGPQSSAQPIDNPSNLSAIANNIKARNFSEISKALSVRPALSDLGKTVNAEVASPAVQEQSGGEFTDAPLPSATQSTLGGIPSWVDPATGEIQAGAQNLPATDVPISGRQYPSEALDKSQDSRLMSGGITGDNGYEVLPVASDFQATQDAGITQPPDTGGMSFRDVLQGLEGVIPRESKRPRDDSQRSEDAAWEESVAATKGGLFSQAWFRPDEIERFDAQHGTNHAEKIKPLKIMSTLRSYLNGRQLNETQRPAWDYIRDYAGKQYGVEVPEFGAITVATKAHEAATSPINETPQPTEAQKKAGNYKKGHTSVHGLDISIENPAGSERSGTDKSGKAWSIPMQDHYGYIKGTVGKDKDHLDVFINPANPESNKVFVVDQVDPKTRAFDEHKILMGFNTEDEARSGYLRNYEPGWKGLGAITAMSADQFKEWAKNGKTKQPLALSGAEIKRMSDLTPDPAHVAEGMDDPDNALDHFEAAIPQEDRAVMADVFAHIRKVGLHRQTSFAQQLFNMIGGIYFKRTDKQLAILGANADNIRKESSHELTTKTGRGPGVTGNSGNGVAGASEGPSGRVAGAGDEAGGGPSGTLPQSDKGTAERVSPEGTALAEKVSASMVGGSGIRFEYLQYDRAFFSPFGGVWDGKESTISIASFDEGTLVGELHQKAEQYGIAVGDYYAESNNDGPTKDGVQEGPGTAPGNTGLSGVEENSRDGSRPATQKERGGGVSAAQAESIASPAHETPEKKSAGAPGGAGGGPPDPKASGQLNQIANSPAIEPLGEKSILVKGDPAAIKEKLKEAGVKANGVPNAVRGGMVYAKKHEAAVRSALEPSVSNQAGNETQADLPSKSETQSKTYLDRLDKAIAENDAQEVAKIGEEAQSDESLTDEQAQAIDDMVFAFKPSAYKKESPNAQTDTADTATTVSETSKVNPAVAGEKNGDNLTIHTRERELDNARAMLAKDPENALKLALVHQAKDKLEAAKKASDKMEGKQDQASDLNSQEEIKKAGVRSQTEREDATAKTDLAFHDETMARIHSGEATLAEYRAGFQRVIGSKEGLTAELSGMTKQQLLDRMGGMAAYRYKSEKKDRIVRSIYDDMLTDFWIQQGMFSYGMDGILPAMRKAVDSATASDLEIHAKQVKALREEQMVEAVKDPKTLEDFGTYFRAKKGEGKTFREIYKELTPEQQAKYDELAGEKTRGERLARADQQKTEVRAAGQATTGDIIETKHTKTGADLFVVKAGERVEREIYNQWNATAKRLGGWYSAFRGNGAVPGFQFKTRENAEAFVSYLGGDTTKAKEAMQARRDAFADDRSQTAVERLNEMAGSLEERADASLNQDRKENTTRRAAQAASAEAAANSDKALAGTMRNIATGIENGTVKFLDRVRQKVQVEMLRSIMRTARYAEMREKEISSGDGNWRIEVEKVTPEIAAYVSFPEYTAYRSDLAKLGRQLENIDGAKKLAASLLKVADDVTGAYLKFAKENLHKVSVYTKKDGQLATFTTKQGAEDAIRRSNFKGQAVVFPFKRGENIIIMSPAMAKEKGAWEGDDDKRITLRPEAGAEIVEKVKGMSRRERVDMPWVFDNVYADQKRLKNMGIETPAELRAAVREFISVQEKPKTTDKVKQLEREMVGRVNDGLDFFPTPEGTVKDMIDAAGIEPGMSVLEPSAGMGHIAEQIRESGVSPDVVELSGKRRELLEAKGFNVVGQDFMDTSEQYDRIIMNPPFSDRRDAEHVQHAYELLKPGGRLVAIMGEGVFFGQDKKAQAFREWLDSVGGTSEKLAEGTFLDKSLPVNTGVNSRMVVIDKPTKQEALKSKIEKRLAGDTDKGISLYSKSSENGMDSATKSAYSGDALTDGENLGLKVYHGQKDLAGEMAKRIGGEIPIIPWRMPDSLVRYDRKGRVVTEGGPRSHFELAERIATLFGKKIVWATIGDTPEINGVVVRKGDLAHSVFVDVRTNKPAHVVLGHELSHFLESEHPEVFKDLFDSLEPLIKDVPLYRATHKVSDLNDFRVKAEIVGDLLGDNFNRQEFWQDVAGNSPKKFRTIAARVRQWLSDLLTRITGLGNLGSDQFVSDIVSARKHLARAVTESFRVKNNATSQDVGSVVYSKEQVIEAASYPMFSKAASLENLEEVTKTMGSITVKSRSKVDSTFLDRVISTPEYYFKKFPASGRVLQAALARRDVKFAKEQEILGKDFIGHIQALRKENKAAYDEANNYMVEMDQSGEGFSLKEENDTWKVIGPDGKMVSRHDTEQEAVAAMVEAESAQLKKNGYSEDAIKAVALARKLTNRGFDVMAADMRKIIAEAKEAGLPNPLIGDGTIDEAGRYGIYATHSKKPIGLFATEQQANAALDRAAQMISYVVQIQGGGERSFMSEIKANAWAKKHSGTVNGRKTFDGLSVRMRTDVEMRPMTVQQALAQMGDMRGTYFPRIRKPGEYVLIAKKDGENPIRKSFDLPMVGDAKNPTLQKIINMGTPMGREAMKLKAQGYDVTMGYDESPVDDVFSGSNIATAIDAILQDSMSVIDKNNQSDIKAGQQINQLITMQVADIFKARGYLSSRLKRMSGDTVWEGYETDMGKALTQYGKGIAAGTAKRDTARAMIMAFSGRDYSWEDYKQEVDKPVWADYQQIVEERRIDPRTQKNLFTDVRSFMVDVLRNNEQTDRIIGTMKGLAVLKFLGFRVSSAAVNYTNMFTGVPATISGHAGVSLAKAGAHITRATVAYGKYRSGMGEINAKDRALFQEIVDNGWDDAQFNHEAARELRSELGEVWNKVMTTSMTMFGAVEKVNRATTLFAAYKAVEEKNPGMSHAMIWEKAHQISDNAHGVYGKETVPAWVRGKHNFLRLPYTFAKFSHNYMLNMIDLGYTRGEYKAAAYLLLSPAVLGGAGATIATPALMALASAFGVGGDDPEEKYYAWAKKTFGTDRFARFGLAGMAGLNLKGSLQVNNPMPTKLSELGGAPGAILTDTWKAIQHFGKGEMAKGLEAMLPTGIGSMSKAVREHTEGVTTGNYGQVFYGNEPLKSDAFDAALRFFSFNPARLSGIREQQWNEKEVAAKYAERKKEIYANIKRLQIQGKGITPEINKEIVRYNELVKGSGRDDIKPITPKNISMMLKLNSRASKFERSRAANE